MQWWYKIEHEINKLIGLILAAGWFLTPSFAKPAVKRICNGLVWIWNGINYSLNAAISGVAKLRHLAPNLMAVLVGRLLLYPTQFLDWAQNVPKDKLSPKAVFATVIQRIFKGLKFIQSLGQRFIRHTGWGAVCGTMAVFLMAGGGGYFAYTKIVPRLDQHYHFRKPASIIDVDDRQDYYLLDQRQFTLKIVELPIWFEDASRRKTMVADLTFNTTNRSAAFFLQDNELLLRDRISTSLEMVQPAFPLTDEGKQVLCQKIRQEINQVLVNAEELGRVEQVYLSNLVFI